MMALIFLLLFLTIVFAGLNRRLYALRLFIVAFTLSILWFLHHITDVIGLSL